MPFIFVGLLPNFANANLAAVWGRTDEEPSGRGGSFELVGMLCSQGRQNGTLNPPATARQGAVGVGINGRDVSF